MSEENEGSPMSKKRKEHDEATESQSVQADSKKDTALIMNKTGGAYIPPARLRMMQQEIEDKTSDAYQRLSWDLLKKSIHGLVNKVNAGNIVQVVQQLFAENLVRGRGLVAKSVIEAQAFSPTFSPVYAALVAIVNTKFPLVGELVVKRLILNFRKLWRRNAKAGCVTSLQLLAHLVNHQVVHEVVGLEILFLLFESPTDASVELAIAFIKEVGLKLTELSPRGMNAIFERLRTILHEGTISDRVQYMIELVHAIRKDGFKSHPSIPESLDLVCEGDQFTHMLRLDQVDTKDGQELLNVYRLDPSYVENEAKYEQVKKSILDDDSDAGSGDSGDEDDSDDEADDEEDGNATGSQAAQDGKTTIIDRTETDLMGLRRTIYLTIQSSLSFDECAHKLMKMNIKPEQSEELCQMVIDCCAQQRSYEKFYGLLASRFCLLKKEYREAFERIFRQQYETIHRLDSNKLRNTAKIFGHLLYSDSLPWTVLECIHLNEDETTSSSRIFIKHLFQELAEQMGLASLNSRLSDPTLAMFFDGLLPRDNPKHTRFAINMFTSIGLGGLTEDLRAHILSNPVVRPAVALPSSSSESDSDDSSDSSDSTSSSSSSGVEVSRSRNKRPSSKSASLHGTPSRSSKTSSKDLRRAAIERSRGSQLSSDEEAPVRTPDYKRSPRISREDREKRRSGKDNKDSSRKDTLSDKTSTGNSSRKAARRGSKSPEGRRPRSSEKKSHKERARSPQDSRSPERQRKADRRDDAGRHNSSGDKKESKSHKHSKRRGKDKRSSGSETDERSKKHSTIDKENKHKRAESRDNKFSSNLVQKIRHDIVAKVDKHSRSKRRSRSS
jgi:pre-mRNA-splicing factor CWC22